MLTQGRARAAAPHGLRGWLLWVRTPPLETAPPSEGSLLHTPVTSRHGCSPPLLPSPSGVVPPGKVGPAPEPQNL